MTESEFLISLEEEAKDTLTKRGMKKLLSEETGARISIELVPDEPSARYVEKSQLSGNKDIRIRMNRKYVEKAMEDRNYADAVRLMVWRSLAYSVIEAAEVGRIRRWDKELLKIKDPAEMDVEEKREFVHRFMAFSNMDRNQVSSEEERLAFLYFSFVYNFVVMRARKEALKESDKLPVSQEKRDVHNTTKLFFKWLRDNGLDVQNSISREDVVKAVEMVSDVSETEKKSGSWAERIKMGVFGKR